MRATNVAGSAAAVRLFEVWEKHGAGERLLLVTGDRTAAVEAATASSDRIVAVDYVRVTDIGPSVRRS